MTIAQTGVTVTKWGRVRNETATKEAERHGQRNDSAYVLANGGNDVTVWNARAARVHEGDNRP